MGAIGEIAQAGQFLSGLVSNTGTRMSDEHFREGIARSNLFLEGTTPTNAAAYNTYQDATFGADTQRQADRIKTMGKELGMSPWELTGKTNTTPVQSFGDQKAADTQFLSQQMPLKIAEMQSRTQLANTFLQAQTQKEINSQNTVGGELPKQQRIESAARTVNANASSEREWQNITLDMVRTLADIAPKERIKTPFYDRESIAGGTTLRNFIGKTQDLDGNRPITDAIAGLNTDVTEELMREIKGLAKQGLDAAKNAGQGLQDAGNAIKGAWDNAAKFLGNLK